MSVTIRRSGERGHANHGWLDAYHTFSFADYRDPNWDRFGPLRVLNHDTVMPGQGFSTHGHSDMEIVTYVLRGRLEHKDSMGNGAQIHPGEVQVMSAGTGVMHSEFNPSADEEVELLQMWVFPEQKGTEPWWDQKAFPESERRGRLRLVVSPDGSDGSLRIGKDVRLYVGSFDEGETASIELAPGRQAWVHVGEGQAVVNDAALDKGDGVGIVGESAVQVSGRGANLVVWDLPA